MRILITRPQQDALEISQKLEALGHSVITAPLLTIEFFDGPEISMEGVQAILVTSANGVRAIARRTARRDVRLFAVGPQTEAEARAAGFLHIKNAHGDGAALARAAAEWTTPDKGALLHAAGAQAPRLLISALQKRGFTLRREVLYEARAAQRLPDETAAALKSGMLDAVMHFSSRSAATFADCVIRENLTSACDRLISLCISDAAGKTLAPLRFCEIRVAKTPNQQALLDLL